MKTTRQALKCLGFRKDATGMVEFEVTGPHYFPNIQDFDMTS